VCFKPLALFQGCSIIFKAGPSRQNGRNALSQVLCACFLVVSVLLAGIAHAASPLPDRTTGRVIRADPKTYLTHLRTLGPGDTLALAPGDYDEPGEPPGLPIFELHGTPDAPITIAGPRSGARAVFRGRANYNTVRIANASHVVLRDLEIDGRDLGGDGVNAQGPSHHITLENLSIRGVGGRQDVVGISTNRAPAWNWTIRANVIVGAGTGMYLGNSDGRQPFVAGIIEHNLIRDTIGYNLQIKHQLPWPGDHAELPQGRTATIIRHNVFSKGTNSSTGRMARPNLLVGDVPPTGPGSGNRYEIYGNLFLQNPTEALFQGEGNLALYANVFVNHAGPAIVIQPHNGAVRDVHVFGNTIVASGPGVVVDPSSAASRLSVDVNVVFADPSIVAPSQFANVVGAYADAAHHLVDPLAPRGKLDLLPQPGRVRGPMIDVGNGDRSPIGIATSTAARGTGRCAAPTRGNAEARAGRRDSSASRCGKDRWHARVIDRTLRW
jgi:hypothetical protein